MVKRYLPLLLLLAACSRPAGYNEAVTVSERGDVYDARLLRSFHSDRLVRVEVEYANRTGASFSVKPENLVIEDDAGNRWIADGRAMLLPLVQPGQTEKLQAAFSNVVVGKGALRLRPFAKLAHKDPPILLKAAGDEPIPGNHASPAWDKAE